MADRKGKAPRWRPAVQRQRCQLRDIDGVLGPSRSGCFVREVPKGLVVTPAPALSVAARLPISPRRPAASPARAPAAVPVIARPCGTTGTNIREIWQSGWADGTAGVTCGLARPVAPRNGQESCCPPAGEAARRRRPSPR